MFRENLQERKKLETSRRKYDRKLYNIMHLTLKKPQTPRGKNAQKCNLAPPSVTDTLLFNFSKRKKNPNIE